MENNNEYKNEKENEIVNLLGVKVLNPLEEHFIIGGGHHHEIHHDEGRRHHHTIIHEMCLDELESNV